MLNPVGIDCVLWIKKLKVDNASYVKYTLNSGKNVMYQSLKQQKANSIRSLKSELVQITVETRHIKEKRKDV